MRRFLAKFILQLKTAHAFCTKIMNIECHRQSTNFSIILWSNMSHNRRYDENSISDVILFYWALQHVIESRSNVDKTNAVGVEENMKGPVDISCWKF
mmetsp:Transcript_27426/g.49812  ORF Transcript_27426/g.49812 Transcript_27426/m.49812 type:complete len:97 (-) Transcript_27426:1093-1383(-)